MRRVKHVNPGYRGRVVWIAKKLVRWLLLLLAIPLTVWTADKIAEQLERRRGPSNATRVRRAPRSLAPRRTLAGRLTRSG